MKVIHCDVCGKEVKKSIQMTDSSNKFFFVDLDDDPIEDMCEECFCTILCCVGMMKETGWKPDFHEVLKSDNAWKREIAGYKLCELEEKTGLKF